MFAVIVHLFAVLENLLIMPPEIISQSYIVVKNGLAQHWTSTAQQYLLIISSVLDMKANL